jgi:hypothetical protein
MSIKIAEQMLTAAQDSDVKRALARCESPIEVQFALALLAASDEVGPFLRLVDPRAGTKPSPIAKGRAGALYCQYPLKLEKRSVRLDFALIRGAKRFAIETDGHDFHEKTKEQAASDKSRDRLLTAAGWTPIHFTGSEVYRNAHRCADDVLKRLRFARQVGSTVEDEALLRTSPEFLEFDEAIRWAGSFCGDWWRTGVRDQELDIVPSKDVLKHLNVMAGYGFSRKYPNGKLGFTVDGIAVVLRTHPDLGPVYREFLDRRPKASS